MSASSNAFYGRLSAVLGLLALGLALASAWPGAGIPGWPAGSVALLALAVAWVPSAVVPRALGWVSGILALGVATLETGILWALAGAIPS